MNDSSHDDLGDLDDIDDEDEEQERKPEEEEEKVLLWENIYLKENMSEFG